MPKFSHFLWENKKGEPSARPSFEITASYIDYIDPSSADGP